MVLKIDHQWYKNAREEEDKNLKEDLHEKDGKKKNYQGRRLRSKSKTPVMKAKG